MGLIDRAVGGDRRALARLASVMERGDASADAALVALPLGAPSHVVGVTGPPGAGKSTLVDRLVSAWLDGGESVAVVMVDPSSPFTGGAVLGDRVRLTERADDRVFVRSAASRGWAGGLSPSTAHMLRLFAACGFSRVVLESVGVGQDAVDLRELADTVAVVQVPNLGDTVQTLKAGILEIADVYAVNKADLPGSATTVRELNALLRLVELPDGVFSPEVVAVSARDGGGTDRLVSAIERHRSRLDAASDAAEGRRIAWYLRKRLQHAVSSLATTGDLNAVGAELLAGRVNSAEAVRRLSRLLAER